MTHACATAAITASGKRAGTDGPKDASLGPSLVELNQRAGHRSGVPGDVTTTSGPSDGPKGQPCRNFWATWRRHGRPATACDGDKPGPAGLSAAAGTATAATATAAALPPTATAAAALVGDLQAGVADGQVTQQAGQDLFSHLQPLLFGPPGANAQQTQNQFTQLVQAYDKHQSQGQITGKAATTVPNAISALGAALGVS